MQNISPKPKTINENKILSIIVWDARIFYAIFAADKKQELLTSLKGGDFNSNADYKHGYCGKYVGSFADITHFTDVKLDNISEVHVYLKASSQPDMYPKIHHVFKQSMDIVKESANINTLKGCSFHAELQLNGAFFDCAGLQEAASDYSSFTLDCSGECENYTHLLDEEARYIKEGNLIFKNCIFLHSFLCLAVSAHNLTFENCKFVKQQGSNLIASELKFEDCTFTGDLTIKNIQAKGVHLNSCIFEAECNIVGNSSFLKLDIYNSIFNKNLRIYKVVCDEPMNLSNNIFLGDLTLDHCTFNEQIDLCAKFAGGIYLANSRILKGIVTYNTKIIQSHDILNNKQSKKAAAFYLNYKKYKYRTHVAEQEEYSYKNLQEKLITKISFTDYFSNVKNKLNSSSAENHKNRAKTWGNLRSSFGLIKSNAIQSHNHIDASTWHALEMLAQQEFYKQEKTSRNLGDRLVFKLSAVASSHRQNVLRPIGWLFALLLMVACIKQIINNWGASISIDAGLKLMMPTIKNININDWAFSIQDIKSYLRGSILSIAKYINISVSPLGVESFILVGIISLLLPVRAVVVATLLVISVLFSYKNIPYALDFINPASITKIGDAFRGMGIGDLAATLILLLMLITKALAAYLTWHVIQASRLKLK